MIVPLSRAYTACGGNPTVQRVDRRIFSLTYYHECMACTFCHDSCCQHGATVELPLVTKLATIADELEQFLGIPREEWYWDRHWWDDPDYPGERFTRSETRRTPQGERCIFSNLHGRGCGLHSFALQRGLPVREIKPMACNLFPVLWDNGTLIVPIEIDDGTLICRDQGISLYRSARGDLLHYFGADLVAELDLLERESAESPRRASVVPLPLASV